MKSHYEREEQRINQDGLDIEHCVKLEKHAHIEKAHKENKHKAFMIICNCCNQTMRNQIKESKDCKTKIRNNPFKMLEEIKIKMHGQVRAKCKHSQATDMMVQFISAKQEHRESLTDYAKRFKQSRDNAKSTLRDKFLTVFIKHADKHMKLENKGNQDKLRENAFSQWASCMTLRKGNHNKYESLKGTLNNQCALGNNQWPGSCPQMTKVMTNHKWDDKHMIVDKKRRENNRQSQGSQGIANNEEADKGQSLTQSERQKDRPAQCFKCGDKNHLSKNCPLGNMHKDDWWINK